MNMKPIYYFLFLLGMVSCAPGLSPYTQKLHEQYDWKESDLKKVQFYLSDDIVLRRKNREGKAEISGGQIRVIDGNRYEVVRFRKGTPGVLLFSPKENRLAVSFEDGKRTDNYLMFGPNPNANNRFVLLAADWTRQSGEVTYQGLKWETDARSAFAGLMVDLRSAEIYNSEARVVKGRTVRD